ncbi:MAG: hypothetical protein KC561_20545, partial [Myxococcales bacterium]|nr:hypothetical protein [Myxococcales bacterium]
LEFGEVGDWLQYPSEQVSHFEVEFELTDQDLTFSGNGFVSGDVANIVVNDVGQIDTDNVFFIQGPSGAPELWTAVVANAVLESSVWVRTAARVRPNPVEPREFMSGTVESALDLIVGSPDQLSIGDAPDGTLLIDPEVSSVSTVVAYYSERGVEVVQFEGPRFNPSFLDEGEAAVRFINLSGLDDIVLHTSLPGQFVCTSGEINELGQVSPTVGLCRERCNPIEPGASEDCEANESDADNFLASCLPTVPPAENRYADPVDMLGYCEERPALDATGEHGDECESNAECGAGLVCAADSDGAKACTRYCRPFVDDAPECEVTESCVADVSDGSSALGLCRSIETTAIPLGECTVEGQVCATDGTVCRELGGE